MADSEMQSATCGAHTPALHTGISTLPASVPAEAIDRLDAAEATSQRSHYSWLLASMLPRTVEFHSVDGA